MNNQSFKLIISTPEKDPQLYQYLINKLYGGNGTSIKGFKIEPIATADILDLRVKTNAS